MEKIIQTEYEVARLHAIDKVSHVLGSLLLSICLILVVFAILSFIAAAAVFALAQCLPTWAACLIIGAVYLLLIPMLLACSKVLFVDPIVRKLSGLKNEQELKYATIRAEGKAAVQRERISLYSRLVISLWETVSRIFHKPAEEPQKS